MATEEQLAVALRNAHKAGDTAAAQKLANAIQSMRSQAPQQPKANIQDLYNRARSGDETALAEYNSRAKAVGQNTIEEELQANNPTTGGDNFLAGVGKSIYDTGRGIKQLFGGYTQEEIDQQRQEDAPLMDTGAGVVGNLAGATAQFAIPVGGGAKVASVLGKAAPYVNAAIKAGTFSGLQPVGSDETRLGNTATGAAWGAGGQALGAGAGKAAQFLTPKIDDITSRMIDSARGIGVNPDLSQISTNPLVKQGINQLGRLPFSALLISLLIQPSANLPPSSIE